MPHSSLYACSNSSVKDNISKLSLLPFEPSRTETMTSGFVRDNHRHSADTRRLGWIDLTMKTTTTSSQTSRHLYYIHIHKLRYKIKINHLHSSNEENSQNKRADLRGTVKSQYKLEGTFVRVNIYKLYLLHSHARNSSITYT